MTHAQEQIHRRADHWDDPGARERREDGRYLPEFERTEIACDFRENGLSDATFYKLKAKFGGMTVSDAQRLRTLETENGKLKRLLAEAMLDNAALKDLASKNF